jgi:hypothetical protein
VKSRVTASFREAFGRLPPDVQVDAQRAFELWLGNPRHPSLRFKKVHERPSIYSARIRLGWRALGELKDDTVTWFWIGSHADYEALLKRM